MADDIVQKISLQGGDQFAADMQTAASQGAKAFAALDASVQQVSTTIGRAADAAAGAGSKFGSGISEAGSRFADLGGKVVDLGKSLVGATKGFAGFSGGMRTLGIVVAGGAGLRIVSLIRNIGRLVSQANDGGKSVEDMTASLKESSAEFLTNTERAANNAQAWTDLARSQSEASADLRQSQSDTAALTAETRRLEDATRGGGEESKRWAADQLTSFKNSQQLSQLMRKQIQERTDLARKQAEEEEKTRQLALAHSAEAESLREATKAAEQKAAVDKLSALFGPQIAGALLQTSQAFVQVRQQFLNAFGPDIAAAVLKIGDALRDNSATAFKFAEGIRSAFKDIIIPAAKGLLSFLDTVAEGINSVFGTKLTGGAILAAGVILKVTGTFKALSSVIGGAIGVVRALVGVLFALGGPWAVIIAGAAALAIFLASKVDWKGFGATAGKVLDSIVGFFSSAVQKIKSAWGAVTGFFGSVWDAITSAAGSVWDAITGAASSAAQGISDAWSAITEFFSGLWDTITQLFSDAWESLKQLASDAAQGVETAWNAVVAFFTTLWENIKSIFSTAWQAIVEFSSPVIEGIKTAWSGIVQFFTDVWESTKQIFQNAMDSIVGFFQPAIDKIKELISWVRKAGEAVGLLKRESADAGEAPAFKGGGAVHGPGTETSDSIWARLSRGEFVVRAAAVRKYGLALLYGINRMSANVRGFAQGGLADFMSQPLHFAPAYAAGGAVESNAGSTKVVLNIGGESFNLETREKGTVKALLRFATSKRLTSAGRKASRVGG